MTVTAGALDMLAGDPVRERKPGDFHRHPTTGAPYVTVEKDGKRRKVMYGRPSSFGSALDNPFNLLKWKERQLVLGLWLLEHSDGDILSDDDLPDTYRDSLIARAYETAQTSLAADRGTHIHRLLELADIGELVANDNIFADGERLGIPSALQIKIVDQWIAFRERLGVTALAVEQTVVNDRWRLAGTLDRLDVTSEPILTAYGILDGAFVGDIKTGGLTIGNDGQPNYWVKYPVQLAAYVDGVPYDTDTDERAEAFVAPNPDIALIYHYDLARALAGEVVDWQAIPVNVQAGREGGDLCRLAADFGKRRDLFAMPAPRSDPADDAYDMAVDALNTIAVPVSPVTVEQPAVDPRPDTASPPVAVSAADRDPVADLCAYGRCECGQPRYSEIVDIPGSSLGGKYSRLICYAGHHDGNMPSPPVAVSAAHYASSIQKMIDPYRAAERNRLRDRIIDLIERWPSGESRLRAEWPEGVPTLKHDGHNQAQLELILAAVRRVEAEVGAGWHPDDGVEPRSARAIRRAVDAWAGRDPGTAWFAASLIATFEQCRNADSTFEQLVASFTIEQADRLHDAAQAAQ